MNIDNIHDSLVNGQRKQMVKQIKEYGLYDFWDDYKHFLSTLYSIEDELDYFADATTSYFRITNR